MRAIHLTAGLACLAGLALVATPARASSPPKFTAVCSNGVEVKSNGKGRVRINGQKATVKAVSGTAWKAQLAGTVIDIGQDGAQVYVSDTSSNVCEVTSSAAAPNKDGSMGGVPAKDQQACLAAVSNKANNGTVEVIEASSSDANNTVIIGVGKEKARWQCLVKNGRVAEVMSVTDEGAL